MFVRHGQYDDCILMFFLTRFVKYSLEQSQDYLKHRPMTEADIDDQVIGIYCEVKYKSQLFLSNLEPLA